MEEEEADPKRSSSKRAKANGSSQESKSGSALNGLGRIAKQAWMGKLYMPDSQPLCPPNTHTPAGEYWCRAVVSSLFFPPLQDLLQHQHGWELLYCYCWIISVFLIAIKIPLLWSFGELPLSRWGATRWRLLVQGSACQQGDMHQTDFDRVDQFFQVSGFGIGWQHYVVLYHLSNLGMGHVCVTSLYFLTVCIPMAWMI